MSVRARVAVIVAWIVTLVGVGIVAAQQGATRQVPPDRVPPAPVVISGEDLGFRVDREVGGVKHGALVVRVDGKWVDVQFAMKLTPLK